MRRCTGSAYAGFYSPDIVGNIRVDQAWGLFQLAGALHEVRAAYDAAPGTAGAELTGHPTPDGAGQ
jgi:Porin subfamily